MPLYSEAELKNLPEFEDLDEALKRPEQVIRFQADRIEDAAKLAQLIDLPNLQSLSVALSDVSQLVRKLGLLQSLQEITFQACKLTEFPMSLLSLRNLRRLGLGNNSMRELPEDLTDLTSLEVLRVVQGKLERIPNSIEKLTRLTGLYLGYNRIASLPESLSDLARLERLALNSNELEELPAGIGNLCELRSLSLEHNGLRTLPDSIGQLRQLEYLSLDHNPFESLPACLAEMAKTARLSIESAKRPLFMDWSYPHSPKPPQVELADLDLFVSPASELYPPLLEAIGDAGLAEVAPAIVAVAREAIQIESTVPDDYAQPGCSRLGGFPDLPCAADFPRAEDGCWIFLAQLNLTDLAPFNRFLPRTGLLSFFLDSTEGLQAKVLYHPAGTSTTTIQHGGADEMISPDDDNTQTPNRVKFTRKFSLPHAAPDRIEDDRLQSLYDDCETLHCSVDHQINGHAFTQHESPQAQAADAMRGRAEEWVPLLQLGWDGKVGFCFWDAGTITFSIHQEDLRRWDFSRVHASLESS